MKVPLSELQAQAVPVLDWLLDPGDLTRGTGRSLALAIGFVRAAARNPGHWVGVFDHATQTRDMQGILLNYIREFCAEDARLVDSIEVRGRNEFRLVLEEPIDNWLPQLQGHPMELGEALRHFQTRVGLTPPAPPESPRRSVWEHRMED